MKTLVRLCSVIAIVSFTCFNLLSAQKTYQFELHGHITNTPVMCDIVISGTVTYHVNFHVNKDGELTNLHWNIKSSNIYNSATGEKYKIMDVGNDNLGLWWDFFNTLNESNEPFPGELYYDEEDGWLEDYIPVNMPNSGKAATLNFKLVGKRGAKFTYSSLVVVNVNANGELTAEVIKSRLDCD